MIVSESDGDGEHALDAESLEGSIAELRHRSRSLTTGITELTAQSQRLSDEIVRHQSGGQAGAGQQEAFDDPPEPASSNPSQ